MKNKKLIAEKLFHTHLGQPVEKIGKYILLCNSQDYVDKFAQKFKVKVTTGFVMPSATFEGITIINFGTGSPRAAAIMDLLLAVKPNAVLFLAECGGLKKKSSVGDLILPIGAIRGERTSDDYFPPEVPALPAFALHKVVAEIIGRTGAAYLTGTVYTSNRLIWAHDEVFKDHLKKVQALATDMETATIFIAGFRNKIPTGALLLVSDLPMVSSEIKTAVSSSTVTTKFGSKHLEIGILSLGFLINHGVKVRHLKF
ncbi:MAG: AMP nucleosidase [bacterium]